MSLDTSALQVALSNHERADHGATEIVEIPDDCVADIKRRYDAITAMDPAPRLPADAVDSIALMLWTRGIGSRQGGRNAAEDIVAWIRKVAT